MGWPGRKPDWNEPLAHCVSKRACSAEPRTWTRSSRLKFCVLDSEEDSRSENFHPTTFVHSQALLGCKLYQPQVTSKNTVLYKKVSTSKQTLKYWRGLLKGRVKKNLLDMQPISCSLILVLCSNNNSYRSHPEPSTREELAFKNTVCQKRTRSFTVSLQRRKLKAWIWLVFPILSEQKVEKITDLNVKQKIIRFLEDDKKKLWGVLNWHPLEWEKAIEQLAC